MNILTNRIDWVPTKKINQEKVTELIQSSIASKQFTNNGPNVKLLEKVIREKFMIDSSKAIIVVTNGSVALHSLATSIEYFHKKKINWATQSFTFPPSAQGTLSKTKIIDIDKGGGLNLEELDDSINGIIVTNIFGNVVDISKYENWAKKNNKFLIFDNAATPFGFYLNKEQLWVREGNNNKMSDISAIYIIQYLDNFDRIVRKHKELYSYFKKQITKLNLPLQLFPSFHDEDKIMASCFCLLFDNYNDTIKEELLENDIFCRKYYHPLLETKNTMEIFKKILCVPCTVDMNTKDIDFIINLILLRM